MADLLPALNLRRLFTESQLCLESFGCMGRRGEVVYQRYFTSCRLHQRGRRKQVGFFKFWRLGPFDT